MAYVKQNFRSGDVLHAEDLNKMDAQIKANETSIDSLNTAAQTTSDAIDALSGQFSTFSNEVQGSLSTLEEDVGRIKNQMGDISIDKDDLGLYQDLDTGYVYPTYKGEPSENGIPLASSGGGGGGGGDIISAVLTVENTTGWLSKTIADGSDCTVSFTWSSVDDGSPTGNGNVRIIVNEIVRTTYEVQQGNISVNLKPYLSAGQNKVKVRISDTYDQGKTTTFNITSMVLTLSSTFDASTPYSSAITFPYTPTGAIEKTVKFYLDGSLLGTQVTSVSGRQATYSIPAQSHGGHSLRVYFEATINNETVRSNELYYEFIYVDPLSTTTIITSSYSTSNVPQYSTIAIPYQVYNPSSLTAEVEIFVNNTSVSTQTVDRTQHAFSYRANESGTLEIRFVSGGVTKTISITVAESEIDVEAETESLVLFLSSEGRSNAEAHPNIWTFGNIESTFSGFNWVSDGWQLDKDNIPCLRVSGDARLTIPYKIFANDFRTTGKTIELEFATRNVLDYDATILSCMSGGRGISVTAQKATLTSEGSEISTQYKEDEHIRLSFVVEKRNEYRLIFIYINGTASGVVRYPVDDDFSQQSPVNISVGSNDCTIDLYCIRVYDNDLTRGQIVNNFIADTQDGALMLERYTRNNIFDAYGNVVTSSLPSDLPYMVISCAELPQYKGDKKTCNITYTDRLYPSKSYTSDGVQIDVQGTSSQYYPRKNYKTKHKNGFANNGNTSSKYAINSDAIPVNVFCLKADVASSEGANNVELARLFNIATPYKTPAQIANPKVRQTIDGFPIAVFWNNTSTGETTFIGCYNYNNDKSTEEVFGFASPDESWEIKNNTSSRVLWKSADYSGSGWLDDFEARYPDTDPAYEDATQLSEFAAWVVSTDRAAATNNALSTSVTYDGVTYTTDSADYRLAKFKAEAGNYMELQSAMYYYLFTELFLMVDSRAKNAFPSFIGSEVSA